MDDRSKKRSRSVLYCGINDRRNRSAKSVRSGKIIAAALLTLATLSTKCNVEHVSVVAFTPSSAGGASLTTGLVKIDNLATKMDPMSNNRLGQRRHVSPTMIDDDSATKPVDAATIDHALPVMTSPILNQQRRSMLGSTNAAENVLVVEDEYFRQNSKKSPNTNKRMNELAVQVVLNQEIESIPSKDNRRTNSTTRSHHSRISHPMSSKSKPKRRKQLKNKITSNGRKRNSSLLTREEERQITYKVRDLRRVVEIRDQLIAGRHEWPGCHPSFGYDGESSNYPTEEEWAKACDLGVAELRTIMSEGQEARSLLVSANVGLVTSIAKRHYRVLKQMTNADGGVGTILTLQDMIQEGNLGLMKAAERFEPERGWRFSTYATYWIRQRILQSITDTARVIRLPAHVTATLQKLSKARKDMTAENGRTPSDSELADHLNISVEKLRKINEKSRSVVSLESPRRLGNNHKAEMDRRTIGDFIASDAPTPEEDAQQKSLQRDIRAVVNELADREREVLILRYGLENGEPMSTSQTASHLGITSDRVRYVETRALNKLRSPQRNYRLKDYLGEGSHTVVDNKRRSKISVSTTGKSSSKHNESLRKKKQAAPIAKEKFWFF